MSGKKVIKMLFCSSYTMRKYLKVKSELEITNPLGLTAKVHVRGAYCNSDGVFLPFTDNKLTCLGNREKIAPINIF